MVIGGAISLMLRDRRMHGAMFRGLCKGLSLSRLQRRLVRQAAQEARVRYPATLLISRASFDHAMATAPVQRRSEVDAIRRSVFE